MTITRDIYWRQGATLSELLATDADLTGRSLRCHVRQRKADNTIMLAFDSGGPADQRLDIDTGGVRITLGAVAGETVQTGGRDARWVYDVEAVLDADPEDVIRTHEGAWIVSADVTRDGTQTPATPDGDLRYLRDANLAAGSGVTLTPSGTGASRVITIASTSGAGALLAVNNLSDLTSAATARTNLGLGGAAVLNVGTTAGTVAAGDDPRFNSAPNTRWIGAGELIPRVTTGAGIDGQEFGTNRQNLDYLAFDPGTAEFAQASFAWPGAATTATARLYWTAASGSGAVVWRVALRCYADDDAIDQAFGASQSVTDTLLAAGDVHQTDVTSAITPAGSAADRRLTLVQVDRFATDAADTLAVDARLIGVLLEFA